MNASVRIEAQSWKPSEEVSVYLFLVSSVLAIVLALIGIGAGIIVPEIRYLLGFGTTSSESAETANQISKENQKNLEARALKDAEDKRRLQAELEKEKAAKEAAERRANEEAAERSAVWQVATIENRTQCDIHYEVLQPNGVWKGFDLKAGWEIVHWSKNTSIEVKYNYCLNGKLQEQRYQMTTGKVIGHEPIESERKAAPVNYFSASRQSGILMYAD